MCVAITLLSSGSSLSQKTAQQIYKENSDAVVVILTYGHDKQLNGQGSGFLVRGSGLIVTNFHVIKAAYAAKVVFNDKTSVDIEYVCAYDKNNDLALLKHFAKTDKYVEIAPSEEVSIGEICYAIGTPQGSINTISNGIISNRIDNCFQITNPISPGSSGGALLNSQGKLIGVTFGGHKYGQNMNYAIQSSYVEDLLSKPLTRMTFSQFQIIVIGTAKLQPGLGKESSEPKPEETSVADDETNTEIESGTSGTFSYNFGGNFLLVSSSLSDNISEDADFKGGYSGTFSYWFGSYGGIGFTFQNHKIYNKQTGEKVKLNIYKGELLLRTSEYPLRMYLTFGAGLANTEFTTSDNQNLNADHIFAIGKENNKFAFSFNLGVELALFNRFSILGSAPFDFIFFDDESDKIIYLVSPAIGVNLLF